MFDENVTIELKDRYRNVGRTWRNKKESRHVETALLRTLLSTHFIKSFKKWEIKKQQEKKTP